MSVAAMHSGPTCSPALTARITSATPTISKSGWLRIRTDRLAATQPGVDQSRSHTRRVSTLATMRSTVSDKSKDGREGRKKRWREKIGGSFSVSRSDGRLILRRAQDERVSPTGGSSFDGLRMSESLADGRLILRQAQDERVSPTGGASFDRL